MPDLVHIRLIAGIPQISFAGVLRFLPIKVIVFMPVWRHSYFRVITQAFRYLLQTRYPAMRPLHRGAVPAVQAGGAWVAGRAEIYRHTSTSGGFIRSNVGRFTCR